MLNFPDIDPIILPIFGPLAISYYSLAYVLGILLGWWYIIKLIKRYKLEIPNSSIDELMNWVIIGIVIGGRMGHVCFYNPYYYFSDPIEILKIYKGGMAFHGGICGYVISLILFAKRYNMSALLLLDLSAAAAPIGLFLGRIANFINAELYGKVTHLPWAFVFPGSDGLPRHPSQLYEAALEGALLFVILLFLILKTNGLHYRGFIAGVFAVLYGIFRIMIECVREPDAQLGLFMHYFTMGQLLSLPMILIGLILIWKRYYTK